MLNDECRIREENGPFPIARGKKQRAPASVLEVGARRLVRSGTPPEH